MLKYLLIIWVVLNVDFIKLQITTSQTSTTPTFQTDDNTTSTTNTPTTTIKATELPTSTDQIQYDYYLRNNTLNETVVSVNGTVSTDNHTKSDNSTNNGDFPSSETLNPADVPWQSKELSLATIVPQYEEDNGCIYNAIKMAIDDINKLEKFITYEGNDTQFKYVKYDFKMKPYFGEVRNNIPEAIDVLHNTYKGRTKTATIGPPYRDLTNNFVEYSSVLGNTHVSYIDTNEPLASFYVFFVQSTPTIDTQFRAASAFLQHFNWSRAGIVYDFSDLKYRKNAVNLRETITKDNKAEIVTEQGIWSQLLDQTSLKEQMDSIQSSGSRIILTLVSVKGARQLFCEAYHRNMFKPKIVWILFETLPDRWASADFDEVELNGTRREINCTEDQLLTAADGYISIIKQGLRRDNVRTISNMTADDFRERLQKAVGENTMCDENVAYAYDALWILANGYKSLAETVDLTTYFRHFYLFGYWFANQLFRMKFEALTGPLQFESSGGYIFKRVGEISIWVHQKGKQPQLVGIHKSAIDVLQMYEGADRILFSSEKVPKDQATILTEYMNFDQNIHFGLWTTAFIGTFIAVVFLVISIVYMHDKCTKLDSPLLNCTIIAGSILCYVSVVIFGLDTRYTNFDQIPNICFIFLCTLSVGFTLTFGGLFAKTWRLYKTFMTPSLVNNKQAEPKVSIVLHHRVLVSHN